MNDVTKDLLEALKHCQNIFVSYAIDRIDGEEISDKALAIINAAIARAEASLATPQPDADGWIPWSGGECPVSRYTIVEIMFRGGHKTRTYAGNMSWMHYGLDADIVAYRIVTEALNDWT